MLGDLINYIVLIAEIEKIILRKETTTYEKTI